MSMAEDAAAVLSPEQIKGLREVYCSPHNPDLSGEVMAELIKLSLCCPDLKHRTVTQQGSQVIAILRKEGRWI